MVWFSLKVLFSILAAAGMAALGVAWIRTGVARQRRSRVEQKIADAAFVNGLDRLTHEFVVVGGSHSENEKATEPPVLHGGTRLLVRDRSTADLVALVAMSSAEGEADCSQGASSTAVFIWRNDRWCTQGHRIDRLTPEETLRRYASHLTRAA